LNYHPLKLTSILRTTLTTIQEKSSARHARVEVVGEAPDQHAGSAMAAAATVIIVAVAVVAQDKYSLDETVVGIVTAKGL
jgi:hypothetical protein